jgi:hypothetical protein
VSAAKPEYPCDTHEWRIGKNEKGLEDHVQSDEAWRKEHVDKNDETQEKNETRFQALERAMFKFGVFVAVINFLGVAAGTAATYGSKLGWFKP